jgi:hypothetical protein
MKGLKVYEFTTMMLISAASAVVLTLAGGTVRNMLQTVRVVGSSGSTINDENTNRQLLPASACTTPKATVEYLQSLEREELLQLFCSGSEPEDLSELSGEWDGVLLKNNGLGMTTVGSNFMSNVLFGMGRKWNGKAFGAEGKGMNRFYGRTSESTEKEHSFDFSSQESSRIQSGKPSVRLQYSNYQSTLSLWKTMTDEVRCLPGDTEVLIGFGAMTWSGGMLNSAPFCLWRANNPDSKKSD